MKIKVLFFILLNLSSVTPNLYAQDSSSSKMIILNNGNFKMNGKKIKLKPYLTKYEESAVEWKAARKSTIWGTIFLGLGVGEIALAVSTKSERAAQNVGIFIGVPVIIGLVTSTIIERKHIKRSIKAYNKRVAS